MLVTVVIPTYQRAGFVETAIESVLRQEGVGFEVVVVDDGSDDGTRQEIETFRDSRLRVFRRPWGGLVAALNFGLAQCRGDLIARLDADDTCEPGRLLAQRARFAVNPSLVLCGTWCHIAGADGRETFRPPQTDREIRRYMHRDNPFVHSSVMFPRREVEACGGYRSLHPCEDYDLWIRLGQRGTIGIIPEPFVTRREDHNLTRRPFYRGLNRFAVYRARLGCQWHAARAFGWNGTTVVHLASTAAKMVCSIPARIWSDLTPRR